MAIHKQQHFVASTYQRSWATKNKSRLDMCWYHEKDSNNNVKRSFRSSPESMLKQHDIYTLKNSDGSRNLAFENKFCEQEILFSKLKPSFSKPELLLLDRTSRAILAQYTAFQFLRTPSMIATYASQVKFAVEIGERLEERTGSSDGFIIETRETGSRQARTVEEAKSLLLTNPFEAFIVPRLDRAASFLQKMNIAIYRSTEQTFITSDNPTITKLPHQDTYLSNIGDKRASISLPLSPKLIAIFGWRCEGLFWADEDPDFVLRCNIDRLRNSNRFLISVSEKMDARIVSGKDDAKVTGVDELRGHNDPFPQESIDRAPIWAEAWGPNVAPFNFKVLKP